LLTFLQKTGLTDQFSNLLEGQRFNLWLMVDLTCVNTKSNQAIKIFYNSFCDSWNI